MKFTSGSASLLTKTLCAAAVLLALQGCGESTSSSAGSGFNQGNDNSNSGGGDNGGNNSGGGDGNSGSTDYDNAQLLANLADNIILPTYQSFQTAASEQNAAIDTYCTALIADAANAQSERTDAQQHWRSLAQLWQQAELMQLGPLAANHNALRNNIYSWPVVSSCGVDQDVVYFEQGNINGTSYQINQRTDTRRGVDVLEYLLFNDNLDHSCSGNTGPLGDWNIRTNAERLVARCHFALEVAGDLKNNADTLVNSWQGDDGFAAKLKAAGQTGSDFESALKGVNAVSDAMFYIDSVTKDAKLAKPMGLFENSCADAVCPDDVEAKLSAHSIDNILANLLGLSKLFYGSVDGMESSEGVGFDDFLKAVGDEQTAQRIAAGLTAARLMAAQLDKPLAELLIEDPAKVEALHSEIKSVTDAMKNEFINSLALELPQTSAGDND